MIEILIVEDEKPISDLIRLNLMKAGYSCTCALMVWRQQIFWRREILT